VLIVTLVCLIRSYIAFHVPLTEDESYYWTWSRRLAFGYTDHPPMVAWLIALTAPFGQSPGIIRLPFITCEAFAAFALSRTATILSGEALAGTATAIAFTLLPQIRFTIGEALPDPPYLLFWSLALMLTAQIAARGVTRTRSIALGFALAGALLSRFFGWALFASIIAFILTRQSQQPMMRFKEFWIAPLLALALYVPFVIWNAEHGWENIAFTLRDRQSFGPFSTEHLTVLSTTRFLLYALMLWGIEHLVALREDNSLIAWTALPFTALLAVLSFFQVVESYWLLGPFASLCVGIGIAYARRPAMHRSLFTPLALPIIYTTLSALFLTLPEPAQDALLRISHGALRGWYSGVFAYRPLAEDIARTAQGAAVLTDRFEIAAELEYHGVKTLIIGHSPQAAQSLRWYTIAPYPKSALFVAPIPLEENTQIERTLREHCTTIQTGPTVHYTYASLPAATFFTTWCEKPTLLTRPSPLKREDRTG
jgi:4-amino-4-deoxy-L-arabinose transferase-like glycosyltransferase